MESPSNSLATQNRAHKIVTFTQTLLLSTISTVETSSDEDQNCEKTFKMSQQGAALQSYNNELVKCKYIYFYLLRDITLGPSTELFHSSFCFK